MELSNSNIKNFIIILQKKVGHIFQKTETPEKIIIFSSKNVFLIFRETEIPKTFLIFQEMEFFDISGNGNPKKLSEVTFRAQK